MMNESRATMVTEKRVREATVGALINHSEIRNYFEAGCLCIKHGQMAQKPDESDEVAAARYWTHCRCSRHPEGQQAAPANTSLSLSGSR